MRLTFFTSIVALLPLLTAANKPTCPSVPTVKTSSGSIKGVAFSKSTFGYLGIPYAEPPVGKLRFKAPVPLNTPKAVRDAVEIGPGCIQAPSAFPPDAGLKFSEDCLTLNVWTSPSSKKIGGKKPVMVFLYGGAWTIGFSSDPTFNFTSIAIDHPDTVFVSLNYRLNIFGHARSAALTPGHTNAGLRDQHLALEWISKNIAAFGGDPKRITLYGQSAGASSVGGYLYSTYANKKKTIVQAVIHQSGQAFLMGSTSESPNNQDDTGFQSIATVAGCPLSEDKDYEAQLERLQSKTAEELVMAMIMSGAKPLSVMPFADGEVSFSFEELKKKMAAGEFPKIPVLSGTTNNEGDGFAIDPATGVVNEQFSDMITSSMFTCFDTAQTSAYAAKGNPTYRYRYMPVFPSVAIGNSRAYHGAELQVLFNTYSPGRGPIPDEVKATKYLQKVWTTFAADPENGLRKLGWPRYKESKGETLVELFPGNNVEKPIKTVSPSKYDAANCLDTWDGTALFMLFG